METRDDAELLRRFAETQDQAAFAEVVGRHIDGVYSAAARRVGGDLHLAKDVTQLVFIALARQAHAVARHPVPLAWLHLATRNQAANVVRTEQRRKAREKEALAMDADFSEPAQDVDWGRVAPVLDQLIDTLGESDRRAVLLRFVDRRSFGEIAAVLQVSEDAARMRVDRALDRLRGVLARRGIPSTAAALAAALANQAVVAAPAGLATAVTTTAVTTAPLAGSVAAVFQLMTATKTVIGAAGVLVALSAGIATREARQWRDQRAALSAALAEADRAEAESRTAEQHVASAERQLAELERATAARTAAQPATATAGNANTQTRAPEAPRPAADAEARRAESRAAGRDFVQRHPELKLAVLDYHRAIMREQFGAFYRLRGMGAEQIERFENALMSTAGVFRIITDADGHRIEISTPTFGDERQHAADNRAMIELLGDDGARALRQYLQAGDARRLTAQVAGALSCTSTPLTAEQATRLGAAVTAANTAGRPRDSRYNWAPIIAEAQQFLSPEQVGALTALQAREQFDAALRQATATYQMRRDAGQNSARN